MGFRNITLGADQLNQNDKDVLQVQRKIEFY